MSQVNGISRFGVDSTPQDAFRISLWFKLDKSDERPSRDLLRRLCADNRRQRERKDANAYSPPRSRPLNLKNRSTKNQEDDAEDRPTECGIEISAFTNRSPSLNPGVKYKPENKYAGIKNHNSLSKKADDKASYCGYHELYVITVECVDSLFYWLWA